MPCFGEKAVEKHVLALPLRESYEFFFLVRFLEQFLARCRQLSVSRQLIIATSKPFQAIQGILRHFQGIS
jgi:hypothetical protein